MSVSSTTVGTVGRFSATVALTMSFLCPPRQNQSGSVIPATPSSSNGAPPIQRRGIQHCCQDCFRLSKITLINTHPPVLRKTHLLIHLNRVFAARNGPCAWMWRPLDQSLIRRKELSQRDSHLSHLSFRPVFVCCHYFVCAWNIQPVHYTGQDFLLDNSQVGNG